MSKEIEKATRGHLSPFERIRRTNDASNEYWESRDLAEVLEYTQFIRENAPQSERRRKWNQIAIHQMKLLTESPSLKRLEGKSE